MSKIRELAFNILKDCASYYGRYCMVSPFYNDEEAYESLKEFRTSYNTEEELSDMLETMIRFAIRKNSYLLYDLMFRGSGKSTAIQNVAYFYEIPVVTTNEKVLALEQLYPRASYMAPIGSDWAILDKAVSDTGLLLVDGLPLDKIEALYQKYEQVSNFRIIGTWV